jgi:hypothetical protein
VTQIFIHLQFVCVCTCICIDELVADCNEQVVSLKIVCAMRHLQQNTMNETRSKNYLICLNWSVFVIVDLYFFYRIVAYHEKPEECRISCLKTVYELAFIH